MTAAPAIPVSIESPAAWPALLRRLCEPRVFWSLFILMSAIRLFSITWLELVPDEAYYWVWSRHLSASYFDHPPMCAWLIWASTSLLGNSEFAVRLPGAILSIASIPVLMLAARAVTESPWTARLTGLILLASPITVVLGGLATPDSPAWFFGGVSIAAACWAVKSRTHRAQAKPWLLFGLLLGLALLSKYTASLIGPGVFLALLTSREGRAHLIRPWFWLGAGASIAVFSPVLIWNMDHDWASFRFQLNHGFVSSDFNALRGLAEYFGGQFLMWTPVLFVISSFALAAHVRTVRTLNLGARILLWCFAVTFCVFLYSSTRSHVEVNWPVLAYAPLAILTALYIGGLAPPRRARWITVGVCIAAAGALAIQVPWLVDQVAMRYPHLRQAYGNRAVAAKIDSIRAARPIYANTYQVASELMFYLPGHPEVVPLQARPSAFDYWGKPPDLSQVQSALFVGFDGGRIPEGFNVAEKMEWFWYLRGRKMRRDVIVIGVR